jgi:hypothetical protein
MSLTFFLEEGRDWEFACDRPTKVPVTRVWQKALLDPTRTACSPGLGRPTRFLLGPILCDEAAGPLPCILRVRGWLCLYDRSIGRGRSRFLVGRLIRIVSLLQPESNHFLRHKKGAKSFPYLRYQINRAWPRLFLNSSNLSNEIKEIWRRVEGVGRPQRKSFTWRYVLRAIIHINPGSTNEN